MICLARDFARKSSPPCKIENIEESWIVFCCHRITEVYHFYTTAALWRSSMSIVLIQHEQQVCVIKVSHWRWIIFVLTLNLSYLNPVNYKNSNIVWVRLAKVTDSHLCRFSSIPGLFPVKIYHCNLCVLITMQNTGCLVGFPWLAVCYWITTLNDINTSTA